MIKLDIFVENIKYQPKMRGIITMKDTINDDYCQLIHNQDWFELSSWVLNMGESEKKSHVPNQV
jgi:hypothetical protein